MTVTAPAMTRPATKTAEALEVRGVDPLESPEWDHWVSAHPASGPFHASAWFRVLGRTYGHRARCVSLMRGSRPAALIPLVEVSSRLTGTRGVCLPFADACDPLFFEPVDRGLMLDVLMRLAGQWRWRHVELRGSSAVPDDSPASVEFLGHTLDLGPGVEALLAGCDASVRRAIRKAEACGVTTEIRTDVGALREFCTMHALTRRRHGLPPQPERFFEAIRDAYFDSGRGAIALASHQGRPVAAAVFLVGGTRAVYKFGASTEQASSVRGNNLAMWHGIRWLVSQGLTRLDFGRTSVAQHGLRRFKRGWGAEESPIHYHQLSPECGWQHTRDRASGLHTALFSSLPLPVNRLLGAALYPHLD